MRRRTRAFPRGAAALYRRRTRAFPRGVRRRTRATRRTRPVRVILIRLTCAPCSALRARHARHPMQRITLDGRVTDNALILFAVALDVATEPEIIVDRRDQSRTFVD